MKSIKKITEATPGYDEDETEYVTLNGIPYTGIVTDYHNGNLSSITSFYNGSMRGYYLWYYTTGPSVGAVQVISEIDGLRISYDEAGSIVSIDKHCCGRILERMQVVDGNLLAELVIDEHEQDQLFNRFPSEARYCRREKIQYLYEEAIRRYSEGTLFEEDWLYTEDQYYDRPGPLLS